MNFDNLFRYHYRPLCLYAIHYIHDVDAAEDIVQECFSVLWEKMEQEGGEILILGRTSIRWSETVALTG